MQSSVRTWWIFRKNLPRYMTCNGTQPARIFRQQLSSGAQTGWSEAWFLWHFIIAAGTIMEPRSHDDIVNALPAALPGNRSGGGSFGRGFKTAVVCSKAPLWSGREFGGVF